MYYLVSYEGLISSTKLRPNVSDPVPKVSPDDSNPCTTWDENRKDEHTYSDDKTSFLTSLCRNPFLLNVWRHSFLTSQVDDVRFKQLCHGFESCFSATWKKVAVLRKMGLPGKYSLDSLDFWHVDSWLTCQHFCENRMWKYDFAEKLWLCKVVPKYFWRQLNVTFDTIFLAKKRRPSPLRRNGTRVKKFFKLSGIARSVGENQGYKICQNGSNR